MEAAQGPCISTPVTPSSCPLVNTSYFVTLYAAIPELRGFAKVASQLKKSERDPEKTCHEIEAYAKQIYSAYENDDDSGSVYAWTFLADCSKSPVWLTSLHFEHTLACALPSLVAHARVQQREARLRRKRAGTHETHFWGSYVRPPGGVVHSPDGRPSGAI